jgi:uncharacterized protein YbaP (TraB family)
VVLETVETGDVLRRAIGNNHAAWRRATLAGENQRADNLLPKTEAQIPPAVGDRLITLRNHRMRDRALSLLRRGGAFIAVGAVHLPGKEGLLSLLQTEGYNVDALE